MTTEQAERVITDRIAVKYWWARALDMFREMTFSNTTPTTVSGLRVDPRWPLDGAKICFTRDADGKRVSMQMRGKKFLARAK
jgi:hypothetical protein